ncbi:uncharacterized protein LOC111297279 [Durio zibethinus]|uniref:Uncharacterized protein LOC111297279 n=1 Tax=Durio zibethinus TaxID=66656 RepID=A0A6P5Z4K2_DURZI|nr:uncharacterized protein LOC111297279 [Durio zibethinus]
MEDTKSRRNTSKRKPLTDLSNTIPSSLPSSQSSSSSLIKPQAKTSLILPLESLLNNPSSNLNSNSKSTATESTITDNVNSDKKKEKSQNNKAKPSSMLSPSLKTPSVSGIGDCVDFEPCTVYNRRHTAGKRNSKGKEIAGRLSCFFETRMPDLRRRKDGDVDIGLFKSCPMPRKKKQRQEKAEVNASKHDLPQDFIDKHRAYFAEVDAFELEEEVASADELE